MLLVSRTCCSFVLFFSIMQIFWGGGGVGYGQMDALAILLHFITLPLANFWYIYFILTWFNTMYYIDIRNLYSKWLCELLLDQLISVVNWWIMIGLWYDMIFMFAFSLITIQYWWTHCTWDFLSGFLFFSGWKFNNTYSKYLHTSATSYFSSHG